MTAISAYLRQNVLGLVAIFLALNAGAYAVTTKRDEPAKTVFNQDLANSAVDSRVLAQGAVQGSDIAAAAVGPKKLKLEKLLKYLQTRVDAQCADGEAIQGILADGSVICAKDDAGAGTITGITTSGGLTGGGTSGNVNIGVDPAAIQTRVLDSCSGNNAIQSVGENGAVSCQPTGTGTVTSIGSGFGLTGGPITDSGNLAADPTVLQRRVTGACNTAGNTGVQGVNQDGTVNCGNLQNRVTGSCSGTQAVQSVGSGGTVSCSNFLAGDHYRSDLDGAGPVQLFANGAVHVSARCVDEATDRVEVGIDAVGSDVIFYAQRGAGVISGAVLDGTSTTIIDTTGSDQVAFNAIAVAPPFHAVDGTVGANGEAFNGICLASGSGLFH